MPITGYMVHAWVVPGWESPQGVFSHENLEPPLRGRHVRHRQGRVLPGDLTTGRATADALGAPRPRGRAAGRRDRRVGADLEPGTLLAAYRGGLFPMRRRRGGSARRGGRPTRAASSRSTARRRTARCGRRAGATRVTVDRRFEDVMRRCADPARPRRLDRRRRSSPPTRACTSSAGRTASRCGRRRSTATRSSVASTASPSAGCSPASRCSTARGDASKVALVATVERLARAGERALRRAVVHAAPRVAAARVAVPRDEYLGRLADAAALTAS